MIETLEPADDYLTNFIVWNYNPDTEITIDRDEIESWTTSSTTSMKASVWITISNLSPNGYSTAIVASFTVTIHKCDRKNPSDYLTQSLSDDIWLLL